MNKNILSKLFCCIIALTMVLCTSACADRNAIPPEGYELPYTYSDNYEAKLKTVEDSTYVTTSTDLIGNKIVHLTTSQSEEYVKTFYDKYFSTLTQVKRTDDSDDTIGYYDEESRLIIYNLVVWTADGETNYRLQSEACDILIDSKNWEPIE